MKKALRDTLLDASLCNEAGLEAAIGIIVMKAEKLDKCGKPNCDHMHVIPTIIKAMKQDKQPKTALTRMERDKQDLIKKGFSGFKRKKP
jgi:hypothetical protein